MLWEGDEWLSTCSLVLMGIFTSKEKLKENARTLIRQRASEHLEIGNAMGLDYPDEDSVCEDILLELMAHSSTNCWNTNYLYETVKLDELNEV